MTSSAGPWLAVGLGAMVAGIVIGTPLCLGVCGALIVAALLGERTLDVPVQLPQLCILAVLVVALVSRLPTKILRRSVLAALWIGTAWPTYRSVAEEVRADCDARDTYLAMAKEPPKMMLVGVPDSWDDGLRFERVVYRRTKLGLAVTFRELRNVGLGIAAARRDCALWLVGPAPAGTMAPFARGWRPERRMIYGHEYEVWLPSAG